MNLDHDGIYILIRVVVVSKRQAGRQAAVATHFGAWLAAAAARAKIYFWSQSSLFSLYKGRHGRVCSLQTRGETIEVTRVEAPNELRRKMQPKSINQSFQNQSQNWCTVGPNILAKKIVF